jgi:chromosome segregation ATPase
MNIFKKTIANDEQLEALQTELTDMKSKLDSVSEDLISATEQATHYQLEYTAANEMLEEVKLELEQLKIDNAELASNITNVDLLAVEKAADIVSEQLGETPASITDDGSNDVSIKETLTSLKGQEKLDYYNANKAEIFKSLKINK